MIIPLALILFGNNISFRTGWDEEVGRKEVKEGECHSWFPSVTQLNLTLDPYPVMEPSFLGSEICFPLRGELVIWPCVSCPIPDSGEMFTWRLSNTDWQHQAGLDGAVQCGLHLITSHNNTPETRELRREERGVSPVIYLISGAGNEFIALDNQL